MFSNREFRISGRVVDDADKIGIAGLPVEAWDKDIFVDDSLGSATTESDGSFKIDFTREQFREWFLDRHPDLYFVIRDDAHVWNTKGSVLWNARHNINVTIELDLESAIEFSDKILVHGDVRWADGEPCADVQVLVFEKCLRTTPLLGRTKTDAAGHYRLLYTVDQLTRAQTRAFDIFVVARDAKNVELDRSPVVYGAPPMQEVNLLVLDDAHWPRSEFENLVSELTPLLHGLPQDAMTSDDVEFLANTMAVDRRYLNWLAESARRHIEASSIRQFVFYGLFRQNLPTPLADLLDRDVSLLRDALEKSVRENIIPRLTGQELDQISDQLWALKASSLLKPASDDEPCSLGELLELVLSSQEKRGLVGEVYVKHNSTLSEAFWAALGERTELTADEIAQVRLVLQLGRLTGNYLPLIRELLRRMPTDPSGELRPLAELDVADWKDILALPQATGQPIGAPKTIAGADLPEKMNNYALSLHAYFVKAMPTAVIAVQVAKDTAEDSPFKATQADLNTFFVNNPSFDFSTTPVGIYLLKGGQKALANVSNQQALVTQLKDMQRTFNLVPEYPAMRVLLENNLSSATQILTAGRVSLIEKLADVLSGEAKAAEVYQKAEQVYANAVNLYMKHSPAFNSPLPYVISGGATAESTVQKSELPSPSTMARAVMDNDQPIADWTALFGSLDLCECAQCLSLYSPAAYFVDIMNFLRDGPMKYERSPLQVLLDRRPDLEHIELTCENTNTPMPYVDLVNEILEAEGADRSFSISLKTSEVASVVNALQDKRIPPGFPAVFSQPQHGYSLTDKLSVRIRTTNKWLILDSGWVFSLDYQPRPAGKKGHELPTILVTPWPQTSWTADELRANPEHIHDPANALLRGADAVHPWTLPLDLPMEEVRTYLRQVGVQRHELLESFCLGTPPAALSDKNIAYEYLQLTKEEADIITGYPNGGPSPDFWDFWGLPYDWNDVPDPTDSSAEHARGLWYVVLQRVSIFLQRSGLTYKELLELLSTYFINPATAGKGRRFGIVSIDPEDPATCILSKLEIQVIQPRLVKKEEEIKQLWNRTCRFVRLWRRLGWAMRDLDKALAALQPDSTAGITEDFLIRLSHVKRLHAETGLPVVYLLGWWAELDNAQYIDHLAKEQPAVPSLYAKLFANKTLARQGFNEDPSALSGKISDNVATIAAGLQISSEDLGLLRADTNVLSLVAASNDPTKTMQDDSLTLANLSVLFRHTTLAKALKLPIGNYLSSLELIDKKPFASTAETIHFVQRIEKVRASGFSIEDLDYLLRHRFAATSTIAASDEMIAERLDIMRNDLRKISTENTFVDAVIDPRAATRDPHGDLTRKKLALLDWDPTVIEQAVATLNDAVTYEAKLAKLPKGIDLPNAAGADDLAGIIAYDPAAGRLSYTGAMTNSRLDQLNLLSTDSDYQTALKVLYDAPRQFVARYMRSFSVLDFVTVLPGLPAQVAFPEALKSKIYFDSAAKELHFIGVMTEQERNHLAELSADATDPHHDDYIGALRTLFATSIGGWALWLDALPASVHFPQPLANKIFYYAAAHSLSLIGVMTEQEREVLQALSTNPHDPYHQPYDATVYQLWVASSGVPPYSRDNFLTSLGPRSHVAGLFDSACSPERRFLLVLKELLPYLRLILSERTVKQCVTESLKLEANLVDLLLTRWVNCPPENQNSPKLMAMSTFLDEGFAKSNANIKSSREAFPKQFKTFLLLHKIAVLSQKFKLTSQQIQWLFELRASSADEWLDLNALPVEVGQPPVRSGWSVPGLFRGWERLADLFRLCASLPGGETVLTDILATARAIFLTTAHATGSARNSLFAILNKALQWPMETMEFLCRQDVFNILAVSELSDERALLRLQSAFAMMERLGASAEQCISWTQASLSSNDALALKRLVRAMYDDTQWLEIAKGLQDPLREKKRAALVAYLVARNDLQGADRLYPGIPKKCLRDATDLYEHFLIDVEMSPCMMTTRIKQAIASVQLFVQRCLMNLEPGVSLTPDQAKEWAKWRKYYRVCEANRKVLFYAENWIEPQLRDDKSPFFKDLESELLQSDLNAETAEDAVLHYLEKLDQVARLDIVGMYYQREGETDILHVFGRTYASPHTYFYRRLANSEWSAWEKLDLDIEGDHLIPIVWNRRLYLFWAIFTNKQAQSMQGQKLKDEDPRQYYEIKFAWSEYKNGKWSTKKISKDFLQYPTTGLLLELPAIKELSFKSRVRNPGAIDERLGIECYGPLTEPNPWTEYIDIEPDPSLILPERQVIYDQDPSRFDTIPLSSKIRFKFRVVTGSQTIGGIIGGYSIAISEPLKNEDRVKIKVELYNALIDLSVPREVLKDWENDPRDATDCLLSSDFNTRQRCYLLSKAFVIVSHEHKGDGTSGNEVTVLLRRYTPPVKKTLEVTHNDSRSFTMAGIGEFGINACNCVIEFRAYPYSYMTPSQLAPIEGTAVESMMMVSRRQDTALVINGKEVLKSSKGTFRLQGGNQSSLYVGQDIEFPFFFQDNISTFSVDLRDGYRQFSTFFHSRIGDLMQSLNLLGVQGLLHLNTQLRAGPPGFFQDHYQPDSVLVSSFHPRSDIEFDRVGAYSLYNWELFFHIPLLIAVQLSQNQRFEEARTWFHYIFDPTATDSPEAPANPGVERFWRVKPFYELAMRPAQLLEDLINGKDPGSLDEQVKAWTRDPFKPHVIARLRHVAYMKAVVMRYLDNLLAWGDQLFRRDTIESINEATQLYVLAAEILGRRPESIPARARPQMQTFGTLVGGKEKLNALSNACVEIESFLAPSAPSVVTDEAHGVPPMPFFCIPGNDKLVAYWDTVADRLFKIRHCMNIEGVERQLAIYEPPIDPALLVRAAAAGIDLNSVLSDLNAPLSHYRFAVMLQKATELCNDVKALGAALLAALEKKDAETLGLLRSTHEVELLKAIREVKKQQIEEADNTLAGLMKYEDVITARQQYYLSREFMNPLEIVHLGLMTQSLVPMSVHAGAEVAAAILHLIPNVKAAAPPSAGSSYGGGNVGPALQAFGSAAGITASIMNTAASLSATLGGYQRRKEDWTHQADLATKELQQVRKQIAAAEVRVAIAERELENHDSQIENAKEVDEYMRYRKFTNQELYSWMTGKISGIYFQGYQLAYDVAKRAERCYRHELGLRDSNFIQFGYWDSLKKGLLSGEQLHHDLKRMDVSYLDQNKRELELTKNVSLAQFDPSALIQLKQSGKCIVSLPETLFDLDYPGHYLRRIKSVSLSIPCVTGPYTSVNCTLTQLKSSIRHSTSLINSQSGQYARDGQNDDTRFIDGFGGIQSIATSHAQNDSGMFELNFRDERYLHFEGTGAISTWQLVMPMQFKPFDYATISDVVLHLKYTARDGGAILRDAVELELKGLLNQLVSRANSHGLFRAVSLRHEFPSEWHRLIQDKTVSLAIGTNLLPFYVAASNPSIKSVTLLATRDLSINEVTVAAASIGWRPSANYHNLWEGTPPTTGGVTTPLAISFDTKFTLSITNANGLDELEEIIFLVNYATDV